MKIDRYLILVVSVGCILPSVPILAAAKEESPLIKEADRIVYRYEIGEVFERVHEIVISRDGEAAEWTVKGFRYGRMEETTKNELRPWFENVNKISIQKKKPYEGYLTAQGRIIFEKENKQRTLYASEDEAYSNLLQKLVPRMRKIAEDLPAVNDIESLYRVRCFMYEQDCPTGTKGDVGVRLQLEL